MTPVLPLSALPTLNAALNSTSAILILCGFYFIRKRQIDAHRTCMIAAVVSSACFLVSYIIYHAQAGTTRFPGTGAIRTAYLTILFTHTVLAIAIVPLVIVTLRQALKGRFELHRRLARITLPIWLYVSVTGVVIYFMLYHL
jgi:putative membrane protein